MSPLREHSACSVTSRLGSHTLGRTRYNSLSFLKYSQCSVLHLLHVVVHFKCQFDWDKGCPDSWWNIISGCVCKGFQRRLAFVLVDWTKKTTLTNLSEYHSVHQGFEENKKAEEGWTCSLFDLRHPSSALSHQHSWFLGLWNHTELYHWLYWFSSLQTADNGISQPP